MNLPGDTHEPQSIRTSHGVLIRYRTSDELWHLARSLGNGKVEKDFFIGTLEELQETLGYLS